MQHRQTRTLTQECETHNTQQTGYVWWCKTRTVMALLMDVIARLLLQGSLRRSCLSLDLIKQQWKEQQWNRAPLFFFALSWICCRRTPGLLLSPFKVPFHSHWKWIEKAALTPSNSSTSVCPWRWMESTLCCDVCDKLVKWLVSITATCLISI